MLYVIIYYNAFPQFAERELAFKPEKQIHCRLDKEVKKELKTCLLKEILNDSLEGFYCLIKIRDLVHRRKTIFFPSPSSSLISARGGICNRDLGMLKVYKPSCLRMNKCSPTAEGPSCQEYGKPYK